QDLRPEGEQPAWVGRLERHTPPVLALPAVGLGSPVRPSAHQSSPCRECLLRRSPASRSRMISSREVTGTAPAATTSSYRSDGTSQLSLSNTPSWMASPPS